MDRWDYKVLRLALQDLESKLKEQGKEGWELVSVYSSDNSPNYLCVLKKRLNP